MALEKSQPFFPETIGTQTAIPVRAYSYYSSSLGRIHFQNLDLYVYLFLRKLELMADDEFPSDQEAS